MAGCDTCPEMVLGVLRRDVDDTLRRVREVKALVTIINRAVRRLEQGVLDEIDRLINLIPDPPLLDLRELVNLITCPLTPQALVTDAALDIIVRAETKTASVNYPAKWGAQIAEVGKGIAWEALLTTSVARGAASILIRIANQIDAVIARINALIEGFIDKSVFRRILLPILQFTREIDRVLGGAAIFVMKLALTTANASLVRATCPSLYERDDLPYKAYIQEVSSFQFDGFLPPGLNEFVAQLMAKWTQIQIKIAGWQGAAFIMM